MLCGLLFAITTFRYHTRAYCGLCYETDAYIEYIGYCTVECTAENHAMSVDNILESDKDNELSVPGGTIKAPNDCSHICNRDVHE